MRHFSFALLALGSVLVSPAFAQSGEPEQTWELTSGKVTLSLPAEPESMLGLKVENLRSATINSPGSTTFALDLALSPFQFVGSDYRLSRYASTGFMARGGLDLSIGRNRLSFQSFRLRATGEAPRARFELVGMDVATKRSVTLNVTGSLVQFDPVSNRFAMHYGDIRFTPDAAARLGQPELVNFVVGTVTVDGTMRMLSGPALPPPPVDVPANPRSLYDVGICNIRSLTGVARSGTFGSGFTAVSASTTSTNFNANPVPWFAATTSIPTNSNTTPLNIMNPNHPVIAQNLYRIENGRFEQIGESWVKHGFLATNTTECYSPGSANLPGINPGPGGCSGSGGSTLNVGCNDTYGSGLNSDRNYMGPKSEINPFTGTWNPVGSYFAMGQPDDRRRRNGSQRINLTTGLREGWTPTALENRMPVADTDLNRPSAQFFYEAYYISVSEIDKYNQIMWRQSTVTNGGSSFSFADTSNYGMGPAINMWPGATKVTASPRTAGDAIIALRTTTMPDGWTFYDYAVYVHDVDRQIDAFFIPVADSVPVRNITFRDIDSSATNDWTTSRSGGEIRWIMPTSGSPNPLSWGRVYNFRFEANSAPVSSFAQADLLKAGTFPWLTAAINGPTPSTAPVSGTLTLEARTGPAPVTVNLRLTPEGGSAAVVVSGVSVNPSTGAYTAQVPVRGRYSVSVVGAPFLRRNLATIVNIGPDGASGVNLSLENGDVDGSGEVDASDIDSVIAAFGFTGALPADVDGSEEVDASDIDIVIANFGSEGDA